MTLEIKPNRENWSFYDHMPEGMFEHYARKLGLDHAPELDIIDYTWKKAKSVLEIGAGEGRIIDELRRRSYSGHVYALERCPKLCSRLKKKYLKHKRLDILQGSLLDRELPRAECGLWMWAGIIEFSPEEQEKAIAKLSKSVDTLCIEVPVLGEIKATVQQGNIGFLEAPWNQIIHYYWPSSEEIERYLAKSDFAGFSRLSYTTNMNRRRVIYRLGKSLPKNKMP